MARTVTLTMGLALGAGLGAIGCLSGDDTVAPRGIDAGIDLPDTSVPSADANGVVDGAGDTGVDARPPIDAAPEASPPDTGVDAGPPHDASGITATGAVVPGGTLGKSKGYSLNGTVGPAAAPVLKSTTYRLVGGLSATSEHK